MLEHDLVGGEEGDACCKSCHVQFVYVSGTFFFFFSVCACVAYVHAWLGNKRRPSAVPSWCLSSTSFGTHGKGRRDRLLPS